MNDYFSYYWLIYRWLSFILYNFALLFEGLKKSVGGGNAPQFCSPSWQIGDAATWEYLEFVIEIISPQKITNHFLKYLNSHFCQSAKLSLIILTTNRQLELNSRGGRS